MSKRLIETVFSKLREPNSNIKEVAKSVEVSSTTVLNLVKLLSFNTRELPEIFGFDEFKANTNQGKYACSIVDIVNKKIIDILPDRKKAALIEYFKQITNRDKVKCVVIDMWSDYEDIIRIYFKNAVIVTDKFHIVRHVVWALENVRKRVQSKLGKSYRLLFKRSRKLLACRKSKLNEKGIEKLEHLLSINYDLLQAHSIKEQFLEFYNNDSFDDAKKWLSKFILYLQNCGIEEFKSFSVTLINWSETICNYFKYKYTNGCTEGFNNKIKVIKRNAFGFRNFNNYRNRILHICN